MAMKKNVASPSEAATAQVVGNVTPNIDDLGGTAALGLRRDNRLRIGNVIPYGTKVGNNLEVLVEGRSTVLGQLCANDDGSEDIGIAGEIQ